MFLLKNPEGKFLDTDYHSVLRHGRWRDKPRLYKSRTGLRQAIGELTPSIEEFLGGPPPRWDKLNTREVYEVRQLYYKRLRAIKTDQYFELLAKDGYELIEVEINL